MHRDLALLLLLVVGCSLPFLRQPFHMDDNFYMDMARNARQKPLYPNDTPYNFEGRVLPDMGSHSHPPMQTYFLAVLQRSFGEGPGKEWLYHSSALIFPILAVASFYFLCARVVERPIWPSMMLAACPLFLVVQHTLMTDIPMLAYWLGAIASFMWAVETNKRWLFLISSLFQFAAMFTSYQSFALTPLLAFYLVRTKGGRTGWLAIAAPLLAMFGWFGLGYHHYHRMLLVDTFGYMRSRHPVEVGAVINRICAALQYQGWLVIFPFFLLYALARALRGRLFILSVVASMCLAQVLIPNYRLSDKLIFVIGIPAGLFVTLRFIAFFKDSLCSPEGSLGVRPIDGQFLGLWYFGVLVYCVFVLTEGSARYLLPLLPPILILFFRHLECLEAVEYRLRPRPLLNSAMLASGSLILSLGWGLLLSHADLEFARIYPRAAREVSRLTAGMALFFGGEWGFRYYLTQEGGRQTPVDESQVAGGSWLARPRLALPYDTPRALDSMTMSVQTLAYEPSTPIRLLDWRTPAGFWSTGWGLIPFSLSRKPLEEVDLLQVNFLVERLPWAKIKCSGRMPPWPGYLDAQGKSPLALLVQPDTRIVYEWSAPEELNLDLECRLGSNAYTDGSRRRFHLGIRQLDASGTLLAESALDLCPGLRKEDRKWHMVRLSLRPRPRGGEYLEIACECDETAAAGTVAFAGAILRHP